MGTFRDRIVSLAESKVKKAKPFKMVKPIKAKASPFALKPVDRPKLKTAKPLKGPGTPKKAKSKDDIRQSMMVRSEQALAAIWERKQQLSEAEAEAVAKMSPEEHEALEGRQKLLNYAKAHKALAGAHQTHMDNAGELKDFLSAPSRHEGRGAGHPAILAHHGAAKEDHEHAESLLKKAADRIGEAPDEHKNVMATLHKAGLLKHPGNPEDVRPADVLQKADEQRYKITGRPGPYTGRAKQRPAGAAAPHGPKLSATKAEKPAAGKAPEGSEKPAASKASEDAAKHAKMSAQAGGFYRSWYDSAARNHAQGLMPKHPKDMTVPERHDEFKKALKGHGDMGAKLAAHVSKHGLPGHELDKPAEKK